MKGNFQTAILEFLDDLNEYDYFYIKTTQRFQVDPIIHDYEKRKFSFPPKSILRQQLFTECYIDVI